MNDLSFIGKILILFGSVIVIAGVLFVFMHKIPFLGKLPGDIYIERKNFTFYFPIATSIVISIILSFIIRIFLHK
ncbi:MAG: DUF2905 domain-containing protein [Candidatus Omnitrophica bacterium]|nr:DUF2905 domain-containing protein [Candidatus Omnitrophota bacterium]